MYIYHNGLIIREGTKEISASAVKSLFQDAGWVGNHTPTWQDERFTLIFENSTWAFTVWDHEEMIAMIRVISDQIMAAMIMDVIVKSDYRGQGIGKKLVELCLQKLPHGDWFANTSANNFDFYKKCGFEVRDLSQNGACAYYGFAEARKQGHR